MTKEESEIFLNQIENIHGEAGRDYYLNVLNEYNLKIKDIDKIKWIMMVKKYRREHSPAHQEVDRSYTQSFVT